MRATLLITGLLLLAGHVFGQPVYQCPGENGETLFTEQPCDEQASPMALPEIGTLPGMDRIPAYRKPDTEKPAARPEPRGGLSFGERNRLREIEIRLDGLQRDLRGSGRSSQRRAELRAEIKELEKEHRALEKKAEQGYAGP